MGTTIGISNTVDKGSKFSWRSYWESRYPSALNISIISGEQVDGTVTLNGVEDYQLSWEYSTDGVTYVEHGTTLAEDNTYSFMGLTAYVVYFFRVRGLKNGNYSTVYSNIKFGRTSYPAIINDGNTVQFLDWLNKSTLTIAGNLLKGWKDKLGSGRDLTEATLAPQYNYSSIMFDGTNDRLKAIFDWEQPEAIYAIINQHTWTSGDKIFEGKDASHRGGLYQSGTSPGLKVYAGNLSDENSNLPVNEFGIIKIIFNGANSKFQVNDTDAIIGDFGSSDMGGFNLGCSSITDAFANIYVRIIINRKSISGEDVIHNYLKARNTDLWGHIQLKSLPIHPNQHGFESCDGKLYIIGGSDNFITANIKTCYEYDFDTNEWTSKTDIPFADGIGCQSPILRAVGEKLYFIGGLLTGNVVTNRCFEYTPATDIWVEKTSMPTAREDFGSAVIGTKIYCFGGVIQGGGDFATNVMEVYDTSTDTWDETKADLPVNKWSGDFGVTCAGKIYAISGSDNLNTYPICDPNKKCYCYDPDLDSWAELTDIPIAVQYKECEAIGTNIYVGSGQIAGNYNDSATKTSVIQIYDTLTDSWNTITLNPYKAKGISLAQINNKIYMSGGAFGADGPNNELYELNLPL